ncbi:Uncharacterised protein [Kingella potus]|uniref:Uncharacterized protein n=1 Tax=Kingella potus TaxID=265175 RepID=A0A377R2L6_9NEIS|nr:hypothetical protein [Kingella potus]UOP00434.1 hypothetical protein LVJ84_11215 [Kingella potus]STR02499.1 Uncharacterised protein [Kingella potus]
MSDNTTTSSSNLAKYYNPNRHKSFISPKTAMNHYLWDSDVPPQNRYYAEKFECKPDVSGRKAIEINAAEYMEYGGGRFVSAADFRMFEKFFAKDKGAIKPGEYDFKQMWGLLYGNTKTLPKTSDDFYTSVYQYNLAPESADFVERAFVFGSGNYTANIDSLKFVVDEQGGKSIRNLKITPVNDNFDFRGGGDKFSWQRMTVTAGNQFFTELLDSGRIGKTVPIRFTGEVPPVDVSEKDFNILKQKKQDIHGKDNNNLDYLRAAAKLLARDLDGVKKCSFLSSADQPATPSLLDRLTRMNQDYTAGNMNAFNAEVAELANSPRAQQFQSQIALKFEELQEQQRQQELLSQNQSRGFSRS